MRHYVAAESCERTFMAEIEHQANSFGSADRPLRRYITLLKGLEHVLENTRHRGLRGQALRQQLVNTWCFYLKHALPIRGLAVYYSERAQCVMETTLGNTDGGLISTLAIMAQSAPGITFKDVKERLYVDQTIPTVGGRLIVGALLGTVWSAENIGWLADSLDGLQSIIRRARRRELDSLAYRVTDRQTMLKELRPNSLYYNLLHSIEHITSHNYSSTLLTCQGPKAVIVAETIRYSRVIKSARVGSAQHIICEGPDADAILSPGRDERNPIGIALFGRAWGADVRSALFLPLKTADDGQRLLLVLADSRPTFFSEGDPEMIRYIADRTTPVISNSVRFAAELEEKNRTLDEVILRSWSRDEMLNQAAQWLRKTFDASAAVVMLDEARAWSSDDDRHPVELLPRRDGHRALYHRQTNEGEGDSAYEAVFSAPLPVLESGHAAVACYYKKARQPSRFEHFLLEAAVQRISSALEVRMIGDRQMAGLRRVVHLMEVVAAAETDTVLLSRLTEEVKSLLDADFSFVSVPDRDGTTLFTVARTWSDEFDVPPVFVTGKPGDGITGHVATTRQVYRTGDVANDSYYRDIVSRDTPVRIRSELAGPLVFEGRLLGVIDVLSSRENAFSDQDEALFRMSLAHSSIALAHAQREQSAKDQAKVLADLHGRLIALSNPDEIYAVILDTALTYIGALHPDVEIFGNLYVKFPTANFLEAKAFRGPIGPKFSPLQYFNEGVVGTVAASGKRIVIDDTNAPPPGISYEPFIKGMVGGSEIAVPIRAGEVVDAVINLESPHRALFTQVDEDTLLAIAHEISLAVSFARLNEAARITRQQEVAQQQLAFLLNLSHEVAKSARITSRAMPFIEKAVMSDDPDVHELIDTVRQQAQLAMALERRMVDSFARTKGTADVIVCLNEALDTIREQCPRVRIHNDVGTRSFQVIGNAEAVMITFKNLFDNAVAAMSGSGDLRLSEHELTDRDTLVIDVADSGHGIPPNIRERIWESTFSDDGTGKRKGMGIGMSLVADHMRRLGGSIVLHATELESGTTFRLTFAGRR